MPDADTKTRLEDDIGCLGYFGFAIGYLRIKGPQGYCKNGCARKAECFAIHRDRVRRIAPDVVEKFDQVAGLLGVDRARELFQERLGNDPYSMVARGNMEDGALVLVRGAPKNRGPSTMPWPFKL